MDTTTETALSKAHEKLAADLAKVSQLITPENQQALAMLYRSQRRLEDIGELVKSDTKPDDYKSPEGFIGVLTEDTLSHVSDVLVVLENVDYDDSGSEEFACGMMKIFNTAIEALAYEQDRVKALRAKPDA